MAKRHFRVGDLVRATKTSEGFLHPCIKGAVLQVTHVNPVYFHIRMNFSDFPSYPYKTGWHAEDNFELVSIDDFRLNFNHETNDVESAIAEATRIASLTGIPVKVHHVET